MRATRSKPKVRMNLDLAAEVRDQLEAVRDRTHADSMTEVVRRAVALYGLVLDGQQDGGSVVIRGGDGTESRIVLI